MSPKFKIKTIKEEKNYGKFAIEPLPQGYGQTLGNALRRVLLTSLEGGAITAIKIKNARHQFSVLPGIKEDVVELILNLKKIRLKVYSENPVKLELKIKSIKKVTAGDIKCPAEVEIANPDFYLCSLTDKKAKLEAQLTAKKGLGYVLAEEHPEKELGQIAIDASFTPVNQINYKVEATRVGRLTNFDRLIMEIYTDATINPSDALKKASQILVFYFQQIYEPKEIGEEEKIIPLSSSSLALLTVEELNLSTRLTNILANAGINTVRKLVKCSRQDLLKIKNMGKKSLDLIEKRLKEKGAKLAKEEK